jgi:hypothetical protein
VFYKTNRPREPYIFIRCPERPPQTLPVLEGRLNNLEAFPTRAGMNRANGNHEKERMRVPRTRGDEPVYEAPISLATLRSPHAQG